MGALAYKVVRPEKRNDEIAYTSYVVTGKASIEYSLNKLVLVPPLLADAGHYPLLFDTISNAIRFVASSRRGFLDTCAILECDVSEQVRNPIYMDTVYLSAGRFSLADDLEFPLGTVSYEEVIPREKLEIESLLVGLGCVNYYVPVRKFGEISYSVHNDFMILHEGWVTTMAPTLSYSSLMNCREGIRIESPSRSKEPTHIMRVMVYGGCTFSFEVIDIE